MTVLSVVRDDKIPLRGATAYFGAVEFAWDEGQQPTDADLLSDLIAHPRYQDALWSPTSAPAASLPWHGPFDIRLLSSRDYVRTEGAEVERMIDDFLSDSITETETVATRADPRALARVAEARSRLRLDTATVYRLAATEEQGHECWMSLGPWYHEIIAIDRMAHRLRLFVFVND